MQYLLGAWLTTSLNRLLFVDMQRRTRPSLATSSVTWTMKNTLCCFSTVPCGRKETKRERDREGTEAQKVEVGRGKEGRER